MQKHIKNEKEMLRIVSMAESQGIILGISPYSGSIQPAENYILEIKSDSFVNNLHTTQRLVVIIH